MSEGVRGIGEPGDDQTSGNASDPPKNKPAKHHGGPLVLPEPVGDAHKAADIPMDVRLQMFRLQHRMRQLENRVYDLFMKGFVKGTTHLSLGMEAVAAGFGAAMREGDYTFATYRGHAHTIARGVPLGPILAELCGRDNGLCRGKGGSMHLTSVAHGMMGSYAIIGAHLTIANGAAWSAKLLGEDRVAVAFFGDGTTNIGAFHEALNFAAVYKLPTVFVCENNQYMEYTPITAVTAVRRPAADRAAAYGLEPLVVDGNDADAVYEVAVTALERARAGEGPSLIEAITYRHGGHSRADPGTYRPPEEVEAWLARDPITTYHSRLLETGVGEDELARIQQEVAAEVEDATEQATTGPEPDPDLAFKDLWADGGWAWRN